jgi:hypothetical protein
MKKVLVLFLISNLSFSEQPQFLEGDAVTEWLNNPNALVDFDFDLMALPCKSDEVEHEGILYSTWDPTNTLYFYPLFFKYGRIPPGLWIKSLVKDSILYVVEAGICFAENKYYNIPDNDTITKIPLNLIFPGSQSDTVKADFFTHELEVVNKNGDELFFIFIKGKAAYIMDRKTLNSKIFGQFEKNESENCNTSATPRPECDNPPISEYFGLMNRLKPYYHKKERNKKIFEDDIKDAIRIENLWNAKKAKAKNKGHL